MNVEILALCFTPPLCVLAYLSTLKGKKMIIEPGVRCRAEGYTGMWLYHGPAEGGGHYLVDAPLTFDAFHSIIRVKEVMPGYETGSVMRWQGSLWVMDDRGNWTHGNVGHSSLGSGALEGTLMPFIVSKGVPAYMRPANPNEVVWFGEYYIVERQVFRPRTAADGPRGGELTLTGLDTVSFSGKEQRLHKWYARMTPNTLVFNGNVLDYFDGTYSPYVVLANVKHLEAG